MKKLIMFAFAVMIAIFVALPGSAQLVSVDPIDIVPEIDTGGGGMEATYCETPFMLAGMSYTTSCPTGYSGNRVHTCVSYNSWKTTDNCVLDIPISNLACFLPRVWNGSTCVCASGIYNSSTNTCDTVEIEIMYKTCPDGSSIPTTETCPETTAVEETECDAGMKQYRPCDSCGTQERGCSSGSWASWGSCNIL